MIVAAPQEVRRQMSIQTVIYAVLVTVTETKGSGGTRPQLTHSLIINTKYR